MHQLRGKAVSPGYAEGTAFIYNPHRPQGIPRYEIAYAEVDDEHRRFHDALEQSLRDLKQLEQRVLAELGETQSAIFAAHLGLLQDRSFVERIKGRIKRDLVNVEQALDLEMADLCATLQTVENEYVRERAQDIRDVGLRVLRQLAAPEGGHYIHLPSQSIIIARELLPSETFDLDREHVIGIVTEEGGENSHAAILARALGIPAVTGIPAATSNIAQDARVLVDAERGIVHVSPNDAAKADFAVLQTRYEDDSSAALAAESLEAVTRDGIRVSLLANINRPAEAPLVTEHHLDGVGLFRTEFMFLDSEEPPSFERQVTTYRQFIEMLADQPIVLRTLDLGGDKLPAFLPLHHEANPNLGARGLRFSLAERELFETQIRAIITASQDHPNTRLLLPMVLGAGDLSDAVDIIRKTSVEAGCGRIPQIGAMIETPASLFALDEIFQIADFACIGTNDLTQFMLAADRNAVELAEDYSVLHPTVLRAIAQTVEAGRRAGREVSVCGEAASYPRIACLLVGLGVRVLSMSPLRAARVRYQLRQTYISHLEDVAEQALKRSSAAAVRSLVESIQPT